MLNPSGSGRSGSSWSPVPRTLSDRYIKSTECVRALLDLSDVRGAAGAVDTLATDVCWPESAEAQRLRQLADAQAEREAAFAERAAAQEREADARRSEAESQKREAEQARRVVRRTLAGLAAAVVLALAAGWFGINASIQKDIAVAQATLAAKQTARAQAYVAQIYNDKGRYFEAAQAALAGLTNPLTLDTDPAQKSGNGQMRQFRPFAKPKLNR